MELQIIFFPLTVAFLITALITPISLIFIKKWGLIDDPKTHKHPVVLHTQPIPRGGGIPLGIGVFTASIFFLPVTRITISLFIASLIALVVGTLDDKYDISRYLRFFINIFCGIIIV